MIHRALQFFCVLAGSGTVCGQGTVRLIAKGAIFLSVFPTAFAQGTQFIGFEEFSLGVTPPFVTRGYAAEPLPKVADGSNYPLFEGQKLLQASGVTVIESPNHELIQSVKLHLFMNNGPGTVYTTPQVTQFNSWQTYEFSFDSPTSEFGLSAFYELGERFPLGYAIDAIELTTIPEPQTYWLLTLGLGAILLRHSKCLKTKSG